MNNLAMWRGYNGRNNNEFQWTSIPAEQLLYSFILLCVWHSHMFCMYVAMCVHICVLPYVCPRLMSGNLLGKCFYLIHNHRVLWLNTELADGSICFLEIYKYIWKNKWAHLAWHFMWFLLPKLWSPFIHGKSLKLWAISVILTYNPDWDSKILKKTSWPLLRVFSHS